MPIEMTTAAIHKLDPVRQFDWYIVITDLEVELSVEVAFLPNLSVEEIELPHMNTRTWVAGKANVEAGTLTIRDTIQERTAQKVWEWYIQVYDPETGLIGYTGEYKKDGEILTLDTKGNVVATWSLAGIWPTTVNFGTIDYSANDVVKMELTLRYDWAIQTSYAKTVG